MTGRLPRSCVDCLVRDKALCGSLGDAQLTELGKMGRRKLVPKGRAITWQGDKNLIFANIVSGALKLEAASVDGREQTVGLLFPGDFVGEPFAEESATTVVALTDTELCIFSRSVFQSFLERRPELERALLIRTTISLREARERQLLLGRTNARARLAWFLLSLPREFDEAIELPMSRQEIANYLGLTIETVSRQLTELRSTGVIKAERGGRRITVVDRLRLREAID